MSTRRPTRPALARLATVLLLLLGGATPALAGDRVVVLLRPGSTPPGRTRADAPADREVSPVRADASTVDTLADAFDAAVRASGVTGVEPYYPGRLRHPGLAALADRLCVLRLGEGVEAEAVATRFARLPQVVAAEVPGTARLFYTPDDPAYAQQWHLEHIHAPQAWDFVRDPVTRGSVVAIIDTGLDFTDPDLAPSAWVNEAEDLDGDGRLTAADRNGLDEDGNGFVDDVVGWDFATNEPDPQDVQWHGSGVAACISAATDNGIDLAGLGFGARLMVLKAFASGGVLVDGYLPMLYAADNGAEIINCSWGIPVARTYEQAIVDAVWDAGVAIVAAGGEGAQVVYPAGYDHVFAVSATDENDHRPPWAPYGATIDITAPGANILTIQNGSLHIVSGTSFACGLVSGLAALVHAAHGETPPSPGDLLAAITFAAVDIDPLNPGYEGQLGAGRIDALAAVLGVATTPAPDDPGSPSMAAATSLQCAPNPFTETTWIRWNPRIDVPLQLDIFSADGARVLSVDGAELGTGVFAWEPGDLPSGVYFVRLRTPEGDGVTTVTVTR